MAGSYLRIISGKVKEVLAAVVSAGAGDADKLVALNAQGKLDASVLPTGIGADTVAAPASEALAAGDYVNLYNNAGALNARKADASTNKPAHGYVKAAVANAASATVWKEGTNDAQAGLTVGELYLSDVTPGKAISAAPTGAGKIVQYLGIAQSATASDFEPDTPVELAE